ncbi:unnamed protein product [Urochloa humidicola]
MACLLVIVIAATVLTAPPGKLTHAARTTTSPEAFWQAALPDTPMPESIRELLRPSGDDEKTEVNPPNADADDVRGDDPPPPMNFNYDDYRASPSPRTRKHHQVATPAAHSAKALEHAGARNAASPPAVFFLEDAVRVGGSLPFPRAAAAEKADQPPLELYTVREVRAVEGSSFVVCRRDAAAVYGCRATGPAARAYAATVAGETGEVVAAGVVCRTDCYDDAFRWGDPAARAAVLRLLDVKPGGVAAAAGVCHAVLDAQVLPVREDERA